MIIPTPVAAPPVVLETTTAAATQTEGGEAQGDNGQFPSTEANGGWIKYQDEEFGLVFYHPPGWNGPEVHRWEAGILTEVGTDTVYPYGTGLDERIYVVQDAFFFTVSYVRNLPGWDFERFEANQPWVQAYVELQEIEDGESISDARSLTIRLREVELADFSGIEYISTLSETAQTMIFYSREILLLDEDLNYLRITGSPNNVAIREGEDWRPAYKRVDAENEETFHNILASVRVE